jgi:hypothetical protein
MCGLDVFFVSSQHTYNGTGWMEKKYTKDLQPSSVSCHLYNGTILLYYYFNLQFPSRSLFSHFTFTIHDDVVELVWLIILVKKF